MKEKQVEVYYMKNEFLKIIEFAYIGFLANDQLVELYNRLYDTFGHEYRFVPTFRSNFMNSNSKLVFEISDYYV